MIINYQLTLKLLIGSLFFYISMSNANTISIEQVKKDITFLADDKLKGRANFSKGIDSAADYIASRFQQLGLSPLTGEKSFKQSFNLYQVTPKTYQVTINKKALDTENILILSNQRSIDWNERKDIHIQYIKADNDFRESLKKINLQNENQLIIVDQTHKDMFKRYQNYFMKGRNHFQVDSGPSLIAVLSSVTKLSTFNAKAHLKVQQKQLSNVIGVIPGKEKEQQMLLFSAHYDHLGLATDNKDDATTDIIYNGADDNASGTTAVLNLAEYFSKQKNNQRSLVFVAFAAEELGGFGSQYFSEALTAKNITAMFNFEMIGKVSKFGAGKSWMTGFKRSNLGEILNRNLSTQNKEIFADPYPKQNLFYRSDNATLARLGVPAHSISSSQIDQDKRYHQVTDEVDSLDLKSMTEVIQTLAESVTTLVDGTDTPTRIDTSEVTAKGYFY